jgi:hypothetical protein
MSSNIPEAKRILKIALGNSLLPGTRDCITTALSLMDRKKPEFVARRKIKALTWRQKMKAREMRKTGMSQHDIAIRLGTNHGRVSEALEETEDHAA